MRGENVAAFVVLHRRAAVDADELLEAALDAAADDVVESDDGLVELLGREEGDPPLAAVTRTAGAAEVGLVHRHGEGLGDTVDHQLDRARIQPRLGEPLALGPDAWLALTQDQGQILHA